MITPLTTAARTITESLRAANLPANVVSVLDEGYAFLVAPFVAVDAPRLTGIEYGLSVPRSTATVTVRVAPASASDSVGLLALADAVIDALILSGHAVTAANPAVTTTGVPAAIPVIAISIDIGMKG